MRRGWSLRSRFTLLAAAAAAVAVVGVAVASWFVVQDKLNRQFDDQLRSYAQLAAGSDSPADALATLRPAELKTSEDVRQGGLLVQFVSTSGQVTTAGGFFRIPVTPVARAMAASGRAPVEVLRIGHDQYRVMTVTGSNGLVQVARDAEDIERTLGELGVLHALIGLVGVVVAGVLGRYVARTALHPVDTLTSAAERVARTQDLTAKIPVEGRGEIARLAEAFNAMLAALNTSRTAQRRLVEDAGHELRTPLTSLRNNVELLIHTEARGGALSPTDRARLLGDLGTQSVELSTLVAELVELAKEGATSEPFTPVDLADVVRAAVERVRARAPRVEVEVDLADVVVSGDAVGLERAVLNLLDNAAKWSPPGGTVRVTVRRADDRALVTVADEGPGIADPDLPHVFERFYRAESARALPGSGLGLAIVARTTTAHDGTARAGRADTGGALLELDLPALPADPT
ncbi:HAMP domain-containing sensor histidine kinase [Actinosynnema sp. NPDC020468]|uniref:HAMP domain-containing sensor histidine kinase n=1 Tax=Actinosynnema sp. NPDC020468 TaxID=3154488 RepID=UPI0034088933